MKNTISYLIIIMGLLIITACGGDDKSKTVTTKPNCTEDNSYYDYDNDKRYLDGTNKECISQNDPYRNNGGWTCRHKNQRNARVLNSRRTDKSYHRSDYYGGFGFSVSLDSCSSVVGNRACYLDRNDIHNVRDRDRYHVRRNRYFKRNGNFFDEDGYRRICVDKDDRHLFKENGYWYYDYDKNNNDDDLSDEEALAYAAAGAVVGTLLGVAIGHSL